MPASPRIRYAVAGLGRIALNAVLPAFANARRNSELTAILSSSASKRKAIAAKYNVKAYSYEDYDDCLKDVDAVYIALPNSMHAEFTERSARAGVHVLCEKPMATTVRECERMIAACRTAAVKLMVAYRLQFEPLNLEVLQLVRRGKIGEPKYFTSAFSLSVKAGDIRTIPAMGGGTLPDIGVYCINAARTLFGAEPTEVLAMSVNSGARKVAAIDETTGGLLRFPGGRLASFVTSFNATARATFEVVGTKGAVRLDPSYEYALALAGERIEGQTRTPLRSKQHDQFAPELRHFSDCILNDRAPRASGEDGLQDVRIIEALTRSAKTGRPVSLRPLAKGQRRRAAGRPGRSVKRR
jgi:predicted dehydrogenase